MVNKLHTEGYFNVTEARVRWKASLDHQPTLEWLEEDARCFLHQSMSTPCLDVLTAADGIYIEDARGKGYMDFHGNNVHQLGSPARLRPLSRDPANPQKLDTLPFSPRRFTNPTAIDCAHKLASLCRTT